MRHDPGAGRRTFSATEILDLDFAIRLRAEGDHLLRLELPTPTGHLYQTLTVPFSTATARAGARRAVAGFPRPLEVRPAEAAAGGAWSSVDLQLPVAGTPIVHSSLYGRWTATAYLYDDVERCGRPRRFFIQP